ncbi:MAG: hypothetical protein HZB63_01620, partial [Deltaproteobacteria bacterium]|nr:hypothetical protein [Deltaproteobacteria bacterium]
MTLEEVVGAVQPLRGGGSFPARTPIGAVSADSREIAPGGLFVALPGERVDGADFVGEAFRKGALAAIVSEEGARKVPAEVLSGKPVFVVRNSVEALGDLAHAHRLRLRRVPLVGITGSSGKTSTKEMLAGLLAPGRNVLRNPGNRNNLIGMPLALLELSEEHDAAVMEMGTNQPGEIARLAAIAAPDVGVITNIAPAHLQGLRSLEGVAREKGDLFRALPESGTAVVNATDLRVVREAGRCPARKIYFGAALNEFSGRILSMDDRGMRIAVRTPSGWRPRRPPTFWECARRSWRRASAHSRPCGGGSIPSRCGEEASSWTTRTTRTPPRRRRRSGASGSCTGPGAAWPSWGTCWSWARCRPPPTSGSDISPPRLPWTCCSRSER